VLEEEKDEQQGYDNRIIFLTDAMPNIGGGPNSLLGLSKRAARNKIYTSFIGIGLDFDTDLVDSITKVRGSNYYSVHSAVQFKRLLNEDFNYTVTPIAFDAVLFMESEAYQIDKIYGTPYDNESNAVMKVDTVTASPKDERGSKGGLVLLKLKHKLTSNMNPSKNVKLTLIYEDRDGNKKTTTTEFDLEERLSQLSKGDDESSSVYENSGIQKAILLVKYVEMMHQVIDSVSNRTEVNQSDRPFLFGRPASSRSGSLTITKSMKKDLVQFLSYFKREIQSVGDNSLNKELDVLDKLRYADEI